VVCDIEVDAAGRDVLQSIHFIARRDDFLWGRLPTRRRMPSCPTRTVAAVRTPYAQSTARFQTDSAGSTFMSRAREEVGNRHAAP
jgi:hypothetical protein